MRWKSMWLCLGLGMLLTGCASSSSSSSRGRETFTTPKLDILNQQIQRNPEDAQAYSNRGYTFALLGRKGEARADLQKAVKLKDNGPMRNRVGWAYFNIGDYQQATREFE